MFAGGWSYIRKKRRIAKRPKFPSMNSAFTVVESRLCTKGTLTSDHFCSPISDSLDTFWLQTSFPELSDAAGLTKLKLMECLGALWTLKAQISLIPCQMFQVHTQSFLRGAVPASRNVARHIQIYKLLSTQCRQTNKFKRRSSSFKVLGWSSIERMQAINASHLS